VIPIFSEQAICAFTREHEGESFGIYQGFVALRAVGGHRIYLSSSIQAGHFSVSSVSLCFFILFAGSKLREWLTGFVIFVIFVLFVVYSCGTLLYGLSASALGVWNSSPNQQKIKHREHREHRA
jgi:hypothetical protein